jgi:hypothetical protein
MYQSSDSTETKSYLEYKLFLKVRKSSSAQSFGGVGFGSVAVPRVDKVDQ